MSYHKAIRICIAALALLAVFVVQYSLLPFLPASLQVVQLPLVVVVALYVLERPVLALYAALALGIIMDIFSAQFFGIYTATLLACAAAILIFLQTLFTNRSLYSFIAVTAIASLVFMLVFAVLGKTISFFTGDIFLYGWPFYLQAGFMSAAWHSAMIAILYYTIASVRRRFY